MNNKKWYEYYNLETKKYIFIFAIILVSIIGIYEARIMCLKEAIRNHSEMTKGFYSHVKYLEGLYNKEVEKKEVKIRIINDKVNHLHKFVKSIYPYYDYKSKVDKALYEDGNIEDLPENLWDIYMQEKFIKPHGLNNYELALPNTIFPVDKDSGYVAVKGGEFGVYRPYNRGFGKVHLGFDAVSKENNSVYAIHDMIVWKKYYTEMSGNIIEAKIKYVNEEGETDWYFLRYMHLSDVNMFVKKGEKIKKGTVIATMDNTGYLSTGTHVHIEIFKYINKRWQPTNFVKNSTFGNKVKRIL